MTKQGYHGPLERLAECVWRIPTSYKIGMRVEGRIFADWRLIEQIRADQAPEQVANVAFLPGIQVASMAMPDIHWGYGFCIGGVCATDPEQGGVVSPGGVGYDINCGVRLVRTNLHRRDVQPRLTQLIDALFRAIPAGVGTGGPYLFDRKRTAATDGRGHADVGVPWAGHGRRRAITPRPRAASPAPSRTWSARGPWHAAATSVARSARATISSKSRWSTRSSTRPPLRRWGWSRSMVCVMIHSGSRGLGYQVCDDALRELRGAPASYGIDLPDRQLACAPVESPEGQRYLGAMRAAANFAWANRQLLMWQTRETFAQFFGRPWESLGMDLVYDVAHNIAKMEEHAVEGRPTQLCVHRKGATRAFPPGHAELPDRYRPIGQPVIIPGDMGRASWVLVGQSGQHGADLWHLLPRRRPRDESHRGHPPVAGPPHRPRAGRAGRHRPRPRLERSGRRATRCLQGREPSGRRRSSRRPGRESRPDEADRGGERLRVFVIARFLC